MKCISGRISPKFNLNSTSIDPLNLNKKTYFVILPNSDLKKKKR